MIRSEYLALRTCYQPDTIRLLLVAESPPASGRYFYNPAGATSEQLFAALMREIEISPATKEEGLRTFQARGWLLVDATYEPVNTYRGRERDAAICRDYQLLREDLLRLSPNRAAPIILIKRNVCALLEPRLTADGFKVLNAGTVVYFPGTGRQGQFRQQFGTVLRSA
jgi:hypothetical protein